MAKKLLICTACGTIGIGRRSVPGSIWIELILWICFLVPGLVYSIWRITAQKKVCSACGNSQLVPANSPVGKKLSKELNNNNE